MASAVLLQKLNSVARCIERLEEKAPPSVAALGSDADLQDILMLNLERLVQLCVDIAGILISEKDWKPVPATMAECFDVLSVHGMLPPPLRDRMKKAVGFRNIAVHEYDKINWEIVFKVVTLHLEDFKQFARAAERA